MSLNVRSGLGQLPNHVIVPALAALNLGPIGANIGTAINTHVSVVNRPGLSLAKFNAIAQLNQVIEVLNVPGLQSAALIADPNFATRVFATRPAVAITGTGITHSVSAISPTVNPETLLSIANQSVTEGNSGTSNMTFTVSLSAAQSQAISFHYKTENGTATANTDYTPVWGVKTIAAGQTSTTVVVPIIGDTTVESTETFTLRVSSIHFGTFAVAEAFTTSPLTSPWYDDLTFRVGSNPITASGAYEYRWTNGQTGAPDGEAARIQFGPYDEITLACDYWTSATFAGNHHVWYIKDSTAGAFDAPGSGFTLYFEPDSSGHWFVDFRNLAGQFQSWTTTTPNVFGGTINRAELYVRLNTLGQSDGIVRITVNGTVRLNQTNVGNMRTVSGQKLSQLIVGPYLEGSNPAVGTWSMFLNHARLWGA
jgi:hypothetical protein